MKYDPWRDEFIDREGNVIVTRVAFYPHQFDHHLKTYLVEHLNEMK